MKSRWILGWVGVVLLVTALLIVLINNCPRHPEQISSNFDLTFKKTIIESDNESWDQSIREIGNVVFDITSKTYFLYYSGYDKKYKGSNVFVGVAVSKDLKVWTKKGKVMSFAAEDPYVVLSDGLFYMFYEDKQETPFRRISLATSQDGIHFGLIKKGVIDCSSGVFNYFDWQKKDVSSPVVFKNATEWIMLYEGRGFKNGGKIGIAFSQNLVNWVKNTKPVFSGTGKWNDRVVTDDIIKIKDVWALLYHGYDKRDEKWKSGLAFTQDFYDWHVLDEPINDQSTTMWLLDAKHLLLQFRDRIESYEFECAGIR